MQNDTRNTVVFIVCAMVLLILYQTFILGPGQKQKAAELKVKQAEAAKIEAQTKAGVTPDANAPLIKVPRAQAVAAAQRVPVRSASLTGSISLTGGRIDDLFLNKYKQTLDKSSPNVELFTPAGAANAWFAEFGWAGANVPGLPKGDTVWAIKEGQTLTPQTPVILTYSSPQGLVFTRKLAVDDNYLFTITDTVANTSGQPVSIAPYGSVQRQGLSPEAGKGQNVHEGAIGVLGGDLVDRRYKDWKKKADKARTDNIVDKSLVFNSTGGWLGITDKYWLAAIIPDQKEKLDAKYTVTPSEGVDIYDTNYVGQARTIQPGAQVTETTHLFAGAKRVETLKAYGKQLGAPRFDWAVDWGKLSFLTRPFFVVLEFFFSHLGNFGLAILAMTFCVRLLLFPLANKSYESMSKMKKLAGPAAELKEKYKDDPAKLQQETMALYQREKVNPLVGCIPILMQIPIFLAFYKVLSVTIEMRQAPFFGWIHDLSSRDPTTIFNLFGAIPWDPATAPLVGGFLNGNLHLGVLPLLYGFTMWLTTAMNPPAPDPMQQRIFQLMPIFFTFIMAPFAVGLLIYWTFSNCFSIIQQYVIMHRLKVENPIDDFFARFSGKEKASV